MKHTMSEQLAAAEEWGRRHTSSLLDGSTFVNDTRHVMQVLACVHYGHSVVAPKVGSCYSGTPEMWRQAANDEHLGGGVLRCVYASFAGIEVAIAAYNKGFDNA